MMKITIKVSYDRARLYDRSYDRAYFFFDGYNEVIGWNETCETCGNHQLTIAYSHIIKKLKKSGLLINGYKTCCCNCYYIIGYMHRRFCTCGGMIQYDATYSSFFCSLCKLTLATKLEMFCFI